VRRRSNDLASVPRAGGENASVCCASVVLLTQIAQQIRDQARVATVCDQRAIDGG
jgi:hypothetical protein